MIRLARGPTSVGHWRPVGPDESLHVLQQEETPQLVRRVKVKRGRAYVSIAQTDPELREAELLRLHRQVGELEEVGDGSQVGVGDPGTRACLLGGGPIGRGGA